MCSEIYVIVEQHQLCLLLLSFVVCDCNLTCFIYNGMLNCLLLVLYYKVSLNKVPTFINKFLNNFLTVVSYVVIILRLILAII